MGIVRRCGRPPRLAPIKKPTRDLAPFEVPAVPIGAIRIARADTPRPDPALPRTVTPCSYPLHFRLDRRLPPRLDVLARERALDRIAPELGDIGDRGDRDAGDAGEPEPVICSCSGHGPDERPTLQDIRAPDVDLGA